MGLEFFGRVLCGFYFYLKELVREWMKKVNKLVEIVYRNKDI